MTAGQPAPGSRITDTVVRLEWTVTEPDYVATYARVSRARRWGAALLMTIGLVTVATSTLLGPGPGRLGGAWAAVLIAALIVHMLWIRPGRVVRHLVRTHPEVWPLEVQTLEASREGIVHTVRGWRNTYAWPAIQRIVLGRRHVFLHLSAIQVLTVPRRAFGPEAVERQALATLRAWHRRAEVPEFGLPTEPGLDDHVLRYVLRPEDFVRFAQAIQRQQLRVRPWWVLAGLGLLVALLFVGGPLGEGGLDLMTLVFASAFGFAIALLGIGPWWIPAMVTPVAIRVALWRDPARLPSGDVDLRVGPAGGWSHSSRGLSRFGWGDVTHLLEGDGVVGVMFGPLTGVIVPDRALPDRDRFLASCAHWMTHAPRTGPVAHLGPRRPPSDEAPDPFAPPGQAGA